MKFHLVIWFSLFRVDNDWGYNLSGRDLRSYTFQAYCRVEAHCFHSAMVINVGSKNAYPVSARGLHRRMI